MEFTRDEYGLRLRGDLPLDLTDREGRRCRCLIQEEAAAVTVRDVLEALGEEHHKCLLVTETGYLRVVDIAEFLPGPSWEDVLDIFPYGDGGEVRQT